MSTIPIKTHTTPRELAYRIACNRLQQKLDIYDKSRYNMSSLIFCVNDLCCFTLFDAYEALKHSPLFRHKVKHDANITWKICKRYNSDLMAGFDAPDLQQVYFDLADAFNDHMRPFVDTLRYAILSPLTKLDFPERATVAHVVTAYTVATFACFIHEDVIRVQRKISGIDASRDFAYLNLQPLREGWGRVVRTIVSPDVETAISESPEYKLAVKCLYNQALRRDKREEMAAHVVEQNADTIRRRSKLYNINN